MDDDILKVLTQPAVDVAVAARVLGIGKNAAYKAREAGDIPSIKVGGQYRVPTEPLLQRLGLVTMETRAAAISRARAAIADRAAQSRDTMPPSPAEAPVAA